MGARDLVAHQGAETVIGSAPFTVKLDEVQARAVKAFQVLLWEIDATCREIAAHIPQDVCQLHPDTQALCGNQCLGGVDAHYLRHRESNCSRNTIAVAIQFPEIAKFARLQIACY